jgi:anti-anti-sigma factor
MRYDLERPPTTPLGLRGIRPDALSFILDKHNHPARLAVAGEIDLATCDSLVDAVNDAMTADLDALDIDLSGVTFCGSAGISAFLMVRRRAQEDGKTLRLVNPSSWIKRVFTIAWRCRAPHDPTPRAQQAAAQTDRLDIPPACRGAGGIGGISIR